MKLASRIVLLCLLAMAAMSALFSYFTIRQDAQRFADEHHRNASELVEAIKPRINELWRNGGPDELARAVQACSIEFRHVRMRYVRFDDSETNMKPSAPNDRLMAMLEHNQVTITTTDQDGIKRIHTYFPFGDDVSDGGLEISKPTQAAEERARSTVWHTAATLLGAALLCSGIVVFGGVRMIGRPLNLLVEKTKRIGTGDFTMPVKLHGNSELTQLGIALNEMCDRLAEQQQTIENEANSRVLAEQQLRHADRLNTIGQLAAGVAHELGTPLNVVSGRAALIANGKLSDDEVRQSATTIKSEADRITKIIRSLLDIARRDKLKRTRGDVKAIVEETVDLLQSFAANQHVEINVSTDASPHEAQVDAGQLQQVFTNLIVNAIQSIEGNGTIDIRLSHEAATPPNGIESPASCYLRVDVKDSGTGISTDNQAHIFEPFFTTKDVGEGTGLGLAISYGIVRDHDGWIEVTSKPNEGSCFSVFIPLMPSQLSHR